MYILYIPNTSTPTSLNLGEASQRPAPTERGGKTNTLKVAYPFLLFSPPRPAPALILLLHFYYLYCFLSKIYCIVPPASNSSPHSVGLQMGQELSSMSTRGKYQLAILNHSTWSTAVEPGVIGQ